MGISSRYVFDNPYITTYSQVVFASVYVRSMLVSLFELVIYKSPEDQTNYSWLVANFNHEQMTSSSSWIPSLSSSLPQKYMLRTSPVQGAGFVGSAFEIKQQQRVHLLNVLYFLVDRSSGRRFVFFIFFSLVPIAIYFSSTYLLLCFPPPSVIAFAKPEFEFFFLPQYYGVCLAVWLNFASASIMVLCILIWAIKSPWVNTHLISVHGV